MNQTLLFWTILSINNNEISSQTIAVDPAIGKKWYGHAFGIHQFSEKIIHEFMLETVAHIKNLQNFRKINQ